MITFDMIENAVYLFSRAHGRSPKYVVIDEKTYDLFFETLLSGDCSSSMTATMMRRSRSSGLVSLTLAYDPNLSVIVLGAKGVEFPMVEAI